MRAPAVGNRALSALVMEQTSQSGAREAAVGFFPRSLLAFSACPERSNLVYSWRCSAGEHVDAEEGLKTPGVAGKLNELRVLAYGLFLDHAIALGWVLLDALRKL
jgi:hypothetical protein